ncbi:MAG: ABC transporter substrate-binding protein [Lachnospiraceae bacterium]|nr:ABC transporter substrate-binding protein [Lachnospiraceae bacterium]
MRKRIIAAALAAMLALTAGCGKKEQITPTTESGIEAVKTEEELRDENELAEIENSEKITPDRVAALSRNAASMWKIAGGKIAAGVEEASGVPKNAVFGTENEPDIEAVLNFGADLVLIDTVSENYQDMISLLDMTEGAPPYLVVDIHRFDDYADSMLEMAKYTKDAAAYTTGVIDVRRKNAEVIASGQEALQVLIQTMPLPEGSLLPEADDESVMETPDQAKTDSAPDSVESHGAESGSDDPTASGAAESGTDDSTETQSTESALDSTAESYPADVEKVADKRESITVLLMRVDAEGCTIQGSHDYVSNMFADFGLINVNPGYEEVRVTLPKEEDDSSVKSDEKDDSRAADGEEAESSAESVEADSQTADSEVTESSAESGAAADSQTADSEVTESSAESGAAADSKTEDSQAADSKPAESKEAVGEEAGNSTDAKKEERPANEIEFETVLGRNPDYIFVIYEGKEREAEKTYKAICESREFWGDMTAVRNRHVYTLPQSTFAYPPNDQWDLAYEYLYQMMFVM